jgi:hypothetical protein
MSSSLGARTRLVLGVALLLLVTPVASEALPGTSRPTTEVRISPPPVLDALADAALATARAQRGAPQPIVPVTPPDGGTTLPPGAPNPYATSGLGEFSAHCGFSHRAAADPIVSPGNPAFRHVHDFFGNVTTDHLSTNDSLLAQPTSCASADDSAAYWIPTLLDAEGRPIDPDSVLVYYQVRAPQDPSKLRSMPFGLRIIAGDAMAMAAQSDHIIQWQCVGLTTIAATIPDCGGRPLQLLIEFPDCWDGVSLDSVTHRSHMAYARGRSCPASHPVLVPQLSFRVRYSRSGPGLNLSSDSMSGSLMPGGMTAHGDFINTWNVEAFEQRVADCLRAARVCNDDGVVIR